MEKVPLECGQEVKIRKKDFDYSESFNPNKVLTNREMYVTVNKLDIFERIYMKI